MISYLQKILRNKCSTGYEKVMAMPEIETDEKVAGMINACCFKF